MKKKVFGLLILSVIGISVIFASCSKKVVYGVQVGTTGSFYFADEVIGNSGNDKSLREFPEYAQALSEVKNGTLEGVIMDSKPAQNYVKNMTGLKIVGANVSDEEEFAFAVSKKESSAPLLTALNNYLKEHKEQVTKITNQIEFEGHKIPVAQGKENQIVMVTNSGFAPYELKDGDEFKGIDIEIGLNFVAYINASSEVKKSLGFAEDTTVEFAIKDGSFDAIAPTVQNDETGKMIAMAGFTKNADREKILAFTTSYDTNHLVLVVKDNNKKYDNIKTTDEFVKKFKELIK